MIKEEDVRFRLCSSIHTRFLGVEVGVEATHMPSGLVVKSVEYDSQYLNKIAALKMLEEKLSRVGQLPTNR